MLGAAANLTPYTLNVAENGTYKVNVPAGYDGLGEVTVNVNVDKKLSSKEVLVNANGTVTVTPESGKDGLSSVTITTDVPFSTGSLNEVFTENGTYNFAPQGGVDGFDSVKVKVNVQPEVQTEEFSKVVTTNGTYNFTPSEDHYFNAGAVTVNVPSEIKNQPKTVNITENGTVAVAANEGFTGLSTVTIRTNVPASKPEDTFTKTYVSNGTYTIEPAEGHTLKGGTVKVNVPSDIKNQQKNITVTQNGTREVNADSGYSGLSTVKVTTNVHPTDALDETITTNGIKLFTGEWKDAVIRVNVEPKLEEKTVEPKKLDQAVVPSTGKNGLSKVTVKGVTSAIDANIQPENIKKDVQILGVTGTMEAGDLEEATFIANGTYTPSEGKDGFSKVIVDVDDAPTLEEKTIVENGVYEPSEGVDGFSKVIVDNPNAKKIYWDTKYLVSSANGTIELTPTNIDPTKYDLALIEKVIVKTDVTVPNMESRLITANGTYRAGAGYKGFNKVVVNIDGAPELDEADVTYNKPGDYEVKPQDFGVSGFHTVFVNVDIPSLSFQEVDEFNAPVGAPIVVPMDKVLGGVFTVGDKSFKINW